MHWNNSNQYYKKYEAGINTIISSGILCEIYWCGTTPTWISTKFDIYVCFPLEKMGIWKIIEDKSGQLNK